MAIEYEFCLENDLLKVTAKGEDENLEEVLEYGKAIIKKAVATDSRRILCDETELKYALSTFDTFEVAKTIAEYAPKVGRIAIICNPENIPDGKFWEDVAVNRGLTIKMCLTNEAALEFLSL